MKKTKLQLIVMGLMIASLFVACKKENNSDDNNESIVFTANTEGGEDGSKTYLIGTKIYWMKGDSIRIINAANQSHIFYLTEGKNTQVGRFSTSETFSKTPPYYAVYPGGNLTTQGIATFTVGQTQNVGTATGTFANDFMPMVAHSNTNKLYFKNVFGGLCFKLTGDKHVSRIVLTSNDENDKLWGTFTADCNSDTPLPTYVSGGSNSVELTCDITLTTEVQEFIIMMPPGTMATGFTMTVYDGNTVIYDKTSNTTNAIIERTVIKSLVTAINITIPYYTVTVSANPTEGGTAYIGTAGTFSADYQGGTSCTVTATANPNYTFSNWTENGQVVSTEANYTFNVEGDRNLVANFTVNSHTVTVLANPTAGGSVTGGGTYSIGQNCTVTATPNNGYNFVNWTIDGQVVSTDASYSFTVTQDVTLVANFTNFIMTVTTTSPTWITTTTAKGGGSVSTTGTGTVVERGICWAKESETNMPTIANNHLAIGSGTGSFASSNTGMTGMEKDQVYYVRGYAKDADGVYAYGPSIPFATRKDYPNDYQGRIPYAYSVANGSTVQFSMGNLYYMGAAGGYWKFADYQFEYLTNYSEQTALVWQTINGLGVYAGNPNVNRDRFCFATSNQHHGSGFEQPWNFGYLWEKYWFNCFYAYHDGGSGDYAHSLRESNHTADWGYNQISNGGNTLDYWHTLTGPSGVNATTGGEWNYLINVRSGYRYAPTQLDVRDGNGHLVVNGLFIFPDGFSFPTQYYPTEYTNVANHSNGSVAYSINGLNEAQWSILEKFGTVFLPATGVRNTTGDVQGWGNQAYLPGTASIEMYGVGNLGDYWASTPVYWPGNNSDYIHAFCLGFEPVNGTTNVMATAISLRNLGLAVRLVH